MTPLAVTVWVGAYFVVLGLLALGVARLPRSRPLADAACPAVTVLVSARNEERDLPACLAAIAALDYPRDRLQVVLVDDRSTDGTLALLHGFARHHPHATVVRSADHPAHGLEGKARGIAAGFAVATGEWVCITDADTTVPPTWLRHLLGDVQPTDGVVSGAIVVHPRGVVGVLERISWAFMQVFSAGAAGWGAGFLGVGPNMGIRREHYVAAGGLEAAAPFIAEDLALTRMALDRGARVRLWFDAATAVTAVPVPTFTHLLSQQRRWLAGGLRADRRMVAPLVIGFGWGFGVSLFGALGWLWAPVPWGCYLAARLLFDGGVLLAQQRERLGATPLVRFAPVLVLYTVFIFAVLPVSLLLRPAVSWRGAGYRVRYGA